VSGDNDPAAQSRPGYSIARIASEPAVPHALADLLATDGLPRATTGYLDVYELVEPAQFIPNLGQSGYVVFGESGVAARLCVDVATSAVVQVASLQAENPTISPVNTNLELFRACTKAFIDRFPFYSTDDLDGDADVAETVGAELRRLFESIDPATGDGFWFDLTYDVGMGDWSTEAVLDDTDE
jgi:SUKH-4 immunity protein